jgi:hypothetical protein
MHHQRHNEKPDRGLLKAAGVAIFAAILIAWLLVITACAPKPESDVVLWEQPAPEIAAKAHAKERPNLVATRVQGTSMEPLITAGDWAVYDLAAPFAALKPGKLAIYAPDWAPNTLAIHMAAARSGPAWIMSGVNNAHYENAANGGLHMYERHYWGTVVQVYTRRAKP